MEEHGSDAAGESRRELSRSVAKPKQPEANLPPLSQDSLFDALASRRSRYVLEHLRRVEEPVSVGTLVDTVASWETNKAIDLVSNEHRERVAASLCHSQLPKLSMMGMVEYDEDHDLVSRGTRADQADAYLEIAARRDDSLDEA